MFFCRTVRNCANYLKKNLQNIKILSQLFEDYEIINLINCRLAVQYDGGTKHSPSNWFEYYNGVNLIK